MSESPNESGNEVEEEIEHSDGGIIFFCFETVSKS